MQPTAQTGIVWKISIFLFILLAVVLYKMNDYFKQEKYTLAQSQLRTQIVSLKTSISSQISTLKNVLSSYEYDLNESKINWVQLDPFFGIAKAERVGGRGSSDYRVTQFVGRSGSVGAAWSAQYLQKALSRQVINSDQPISVQLFRDNSGTKFMSLRFANPSGGALIVVGGVEYFQKFFDLSRGGRITSLLETTDNMIAAHSEADYLGTLMPENAVSSKKFLVEREEIAGTNLIAMNLVSRTSLAKGFAVPWSVVGLIFGFGLLIIGVLIYTLDPIERRIEKYKIQEREQVFKETLSSSLAQQQPIDASKEPTKEITREFTREIVTEPVKETTKEIQFTATDLVKAKLENIEEVPPVNDVEAALEFQHVNPPPPPVQKNFPSTPPSIAPSMVKNASASFMTPPPPPQEEKPVVAEAPKAPAKPSGFGSVVLDSSSQVETFDYTPSETDGLDLDKALSLDDIESEEVAQNSVQMVQENLTSKTINTTQQISDMSKPEFAVRRKEFRVDAIDVPIRRPERT